MNGSRILFLICLSSFVSYSIQLEPCATILAENYAFFNLCSFARRVYTPATEDVIKYDFSIAAPFVGSCKNADTLVYGKRYNTVGEKECDNMAKSAPKYNLVDPENKDSGLIISFPKSDEKDLQLTVTLMCDKSMATNQTSAFTIAKIDGNNIYINGTSKQGCPVFTTDIVSTFINDHKTYFIVAAVIVGLFVTFFGLKVFHVSIFLIVFFVGTIFVFTLFFVLVDFGRQPWIIYVIFGASAILGLVMAILAVKYEKVGFFALGACLGVVGGLFLYDAVIIHFTGDMKSAIPFYVTLFVCGLIGGVLTFWLWKDIIIIATSVIGGYVTVRGLSLAIGHFPNEINVAKGIEEMTPYAYAYLAGAIVISILGMYYQFKVKARETEKEKAEDPVASYYTRA